ncbi:hypothetical protein [Nostoc sp. WHI]|uniref:hypothetical protein n=1 Tax=Nostoc sp. WHI TaxID=2650611 RepID=UPI0018C7E73B|nr:hypothetical protein [Nostoc sp. WHI]MBG1268251.1 hypothetical protein [Nostoc sp. WHI]
MAKDDGKTLSRLNKQVNQTIEISEVLAGQKPIGGKLGEKLKKQQVDEMSITQGKKLRGEKFKVFDKYLERMELIANATGGTKVEIKRALIQDPQNVDKLI